MIKSFLNWLGAWLLATLFVFLAFSGVIVIFTLAMMFITWSVPEFNNLGSIFAVARAVFACSAFVGFCWSVSPDLDDEW